MGWAEEAVARAKKLIAEESELLKQAYSPEFAEYASKTGLFFSFGDITHLIHTSLNYSIQARANGSHAGIAYFEELIMRFKLYLIAELKFVVEKQPPFEHGNFRGDVDYNFIVDFLDLFKLLEGLELELTQIRINEGGRYQ